MGGASGRWQGLLLPLLLMLVGARSLLEPLPPLKNRYFACRHGQSTANQLGIISSLPAIGTTIHGLTTEGRSQAQGSGAQLVELLEQHGCDPTRLVSYASDFTRARETAEVMLSEVLQLQGWAEGVGCTVVGTQYALRERWFGELDGKDVGTYNDVWPLDLEDADHTAFGVESVTSVAARIREMFMHLEQAHPDPNTPIVLTSHADTLQIMQTFVAGADIRRFSQYRFANGEVRALLQDPSSLPEPKPVAVSAKKY